MALIERLRLLIEAEGGDRSALAFAAVGAAAVFAGKQIVDFGADAVSAASDLNETMSKSNTIFAQNGAAIAAWASQGANNFGLSKQAALEAAAGFGNLFDQLGFGGKQTAEMSTSLVELAADFASFSNADITQVLDAQAAAFRGEYDALQRFVPTMNAAAIEQKALEQTGKRTTASLTLQEKALATNTLMMEGAGAATGDFDRTSGQLANQQRILKANLDNATAALGEKLTPAVTELVKFLNTRALPALGTFAHGVETIGGVAADMLGFIVEGVNLAARGIANVGDALGADGIAAELRAGSDAAEEMRAKLHKVSETIGNVGNESRDTAGDLGGLVDSEGRFGKAADNTTESLKEQNKTLTTLRDSEIGLREAKEAIVQAVRDQADAQDEYNKLLETGGVDMERVHKAQSDILKVQLDMDDALRDVVKAQQAVNRAMEPATSKDLAKGQRDVEAAQDDVTQAGFRLTEAQTDLNSLMGTGTATAEELALAQIAVRDAERSVADTKDNVIEAQAALNELHKVGTSDSEAYSTAVDALTVAQAAADKATRNFHTAQDELNTSQGVAPEFARALEDASLKLRDATEGVGDKTWNAEKATWAWKDALVAGDSAASGATPKVKALADEVSHLNKEVEHGMSLAASIDNMFTQIGALSGAALSASIDDRVAGFGTQAQSTGGLLGPAFDAVGTASGNTIIQLVLDGSVVTEVVYKGLQAKQRTNGALGLN